MTKRCIIFLWIFIITVTALGLTGVYSAPTDTLQTQSYLRIHIRADSNERAAQDVKYAVRDAVVSYLTPIVAEFNGVDDAEYQLRLRLDKISVLASALLRECGFDYGATASLRVETFPTRVYDGLVLPQGEYMALVIELGSGQGDNWWCVAYPPLCFTHTQNVVYKSKILEIIRSFREEKDK